MTSSTEPPALPTTSRDADGPLAGLNLRATLLIASYAMRFSLRSGGGVVTLLLVLGVGLNVGSVFVTPVEQMLLRSPELRGQGRSKQEALEDLFSSEQALASLETLVTTVAGSDEEQTDFLIHEQPALLSAIFIVLLILMPFVACIGAFNQTAADIGSRGLRYLLLRTERANILVGRFLGTLAFSTISLIMVSLVIVLYIGLKVRIYPELELAGWGIQGLVALFFVTLPHVALCSWVSARTTSAFASLTLCLLLVGSPLLVLSMISQGLGGDQDWLMRLIPWGWKYDLLEGDVGKRLAAFAMMTAFTLLFLLGALRGFQRRDL